MRLAARDAFLSTDSLASASSCSIQTSSIQTSLPIGDDTSRGTISLYPAYNEVDDLPAVQQTEHRGWNDVWIENEDGMILTLPGRGEPGPLCGEWRYGVRCSNPNDHKAKIKLHKYSCHRPVCPKCLLSAANQKAKAIWRQFKGKALVLEAEAALQERSIGAAKHFQISLSPDLLTPADLLEPGRMKALYREINEILDSSFLDGWYAGVLVFHAFRLQRQDGSFVSEDLPDDGSDNLNFEHLRPVWGPHFHFVGYGYMMPADEFAKAYPNWRYKRIKEGKLPGKTNRYKERDVFATVRYLLTHHAVFMRRLTVPKQIGLIGESETIYEQVGQNYKWAGEFRPHKIAKKVLESKLVPCLCEHCKADMMIYPLDLDGNLVEDDDLARTFLERLERVVYYRVDRKVPDRGRSKGIILDEISEYEQLVSVELSTELSAMPAPSNSVSARQYGQFTGDYDVFDHEMYSWGA